jgi:hypothetical protein
VHELQEQATYISGIYIGKLTEIRDAGVEQPYRTTRLGGPGMSEGPERKHYTATEREGSAGWSCRTRQNGRADDHWLGQG